MGMVRNIMLLTLLLSSTACNSLFYHPAKEELVHRHKMPIQPTDVFFTNDTGQKLHAWHFKSDQKSKAIILFFHGNAENLSTHFYTLYGLTKHGFDYLIFDYQGYGKSEGSPSPSGTLVDARAAYQWIKENYNNLPIVIFGQSLGGAIAARFSSEIADPQIRALILDSTFVSYREVANDVLRKNWLTWPFQFLTYILIDDTYAPIKKIEKLDVIPHKLVIHGTNDPIVSYHLGEKLYEQLPGKKLFWKIEGGAHTDFMWRDNGNYSQKFIEYLNDALSL